MISAGPNPIALTGQCLPRRLTIDPETNKVPCLILGKLPSPPGSNGFPNRCEDVAGGAYITPDATVLEAFQRDEHAKWLLSGGPRNGIDPSTELTCEVRQLPPNKVCNTSPADNGWCYMENEERPPGCAQQILFSKTALLPDVVALLQCLESPSGP